MCLSPVSLVEWPTGQCVYLFSLLAKWLVVLFIKFTGQEVRVPISLVYGLVISVSIFLVNWPSGRCVR